MSILDAAEKKLRQWRRTHLAQRVLYTSGEGFTHDTIATQGNTQITTLDGEANLVGDWVDWILEKEDIGWWEPVAGDKIVVVLPTTPTKYRIYEACALDGSHVWDNHGRDGLSVRVHTKFVEVTDHYASAAVLYHNPD